MQATSSPPMLEELPTRPGDRRAFYIFHGVLLMEISYQAPLLVSGSIDKRNLNHAKCLKGGLPSSENIQYKFVDLS